MLGSTDKENVDYKEFGKWLWEKHRLTTNAIDGAEEEALIEEYMEEQ
jgi:hypothetical protein